jgi:peroxiredoxin
MALTPSNIFEKGTKAPDFKLMDTISDRTISLSDVQGEKGTIIFFICNHCPFVIHVNEQLVQLANDYLSKGFGFVAISSNDVKNYPQDAPELMKIHAKNVGYPFPYLYDETQEVAKAYDAACTPDLYVFDGDLRSVYHGQLDNSRPGNRIPVTGQDMRAVLDSILDGSKYIGQEKPSMGCNIKWK